MRILMKKINEATIRGYVTAQVGAHEVIKKLKEKDGTFFVENSMGIVIAVALGGLALTLLFALIKDKIAPQTASKVDGFFNFS